MKITHVSVRNYRSLKSLDVAIDDYTALVGPNGSGKSSILYALDWFFSGYALNPHDICNYDPSAAFESGEPEPTVEVTVTFGDLTPQDKTRLKQYGRGDTAVFRRTWTLGDAKDKVVGNATQGPGFAEIRNAKTVGEFRPAYRALRESIVELPDLGATPSKDQINDAFAAWEGDATNIDKLVVVNDDDANHLFGFNGSNVINECVRIVLVPASADMAIQVGGASKGSALNELIGTLMANAGAEARAEWLTHNQDKVDELNRLVRDGVRKSTDHQATRINSRLLSLIPNASIKFSPIVPEWTPRNDATVTTDVIIDGSANDVSRQGHGVQRAIMIAMLQSLVPDVESATNAHVRQAEEGELEAQTRLEAELANLPTMIICIEEPEIYQHPIRARAFARILSDLSMQTNAQVIIATHSPYFVRPAQFTSLRRVSLDAGYSQIASATLASVAVAASTDEAKVKKAVEKQLPTTFSEGFFSESIVVVEGETDKAVAEALTERLGLSLDAQGVSVLEMSGKGNIRVPYAMLSELGSSVYVVADGDALGARRKHSLDAIKEANAHATHRTEAEALVSWLPASVAVQGVVPYSFEAASVVAQDYTIWEDDIEEELSKWPSFITALTACGGVLRQSKDLLAYRTAVMEADLSDLPETLRIWAQTVAQFR